MMGRGKPRAGEALADRCPLQAAEWHPDLNGDLTPSDVTVGSNRKVWWRCSYCDATWEAIIANRTNKQSLGCKACTRKRLAQAAHRPKPGASLLDLYPSLAAEVHPTRNQDRTPASIHPRLAHEALVDLRSMRPRVRDGTSTQDRGSAERVSTLCIQKNWRTAQHPGGWGVP
jgi:hypothetical protein